MKGRKYLKIEIPFCKTVQLKWKVVAKFSPDSISDFIPSIKNVDVESINSQHDDENENDDEDEDDDDSSDDDARTRFINSARPKDETIEDKKLRKQAVKEAKAEKRKNKIPKHLKKRKEKQGTKKK